MPTTTTATATARQELADATAQAELIASQLQAVTEAIATATIGTDAHVALSQRAAALRSQIAALEKQITSLAEAAKTEQERQEEQAALAAEASAQRLCRLGTDIFAPLAWRNWAGVMGVSWWMV